MRYPASFPETLVKVSLAQIGVLEVGNNGGERVRSYQSATSLEPGPWPWCAAFLCWCIRAASVNFDFPAPLPTSARAVDFLSWGNKHAARVPRPFLSLSRGDLVVYRFKSGHHCGIVTAPFSGGYFQAVEGNTSQAGSREGDGVYLKFRDLSSILGVVTFPS